MKSGRKGSWSHTLLLPRFSTGAVRSELSKAGATFLASRLACGEKEPIKALCKTAWVPICPHPKIGEVCVGGRFLGGGCSSPCGLCAFVVVVDTGSHSSLSLGVHPRWKPPKSGPKSLTFGAAFLAKKRHMPTQKWLVEIA